MVEDNIDGVMDLFILANFKMVVCMDGGNGDQKTIIVMRDNIETTKSMDMELINGVMEISLLDILKMENVLSMKIMETVMIVRTDKKMKNLESFENKAKKK
jgi:hypothetical protein